MGMIDRLARMVGIANAPDLSPETARGGQSQFMRGEKHLTFNGWRPQLRAPQSEVSGSWDLAAARTIDALHNTGWMSGAVEQSIANTVGAGLRMKPAPEGALMGWSKEMERAWIKDVSRRFALWAANPMECDIQGRRSLGQYQAAAYGHWLATGEILSEIAYRKRPWGQAGTKFRLLTPMRLSRRSDVTNNLVNGVYHDGEMMPIGYAIKQHRPDARWLGDRRVRARDAYGRPMVIHVFTGAPETCRGVSPIVPALQVVKQADQLADATLMAAIVQTLFAATLESDDMTDTAMSGLLTPQEQATLMRDGISPFEAYSEIMSGFYEESTIDVGMNGRIAHLFPGQRMKFHSPEHPNGNYPDFSKSLCREIARCLGLTYEEATGDYQGATYASLGRASGSIHKVTEARRAAVVVPASQPIYEAWLEEQIEMGVVSFPGGINGFLDNRAAACRAIWMGSSKPIAEDLKVAKAHETHLRLGVKSEQMICEELGADYEDVLAQMAEAADMRQEYGVAAPILLTGGGGNPPADDPDDDGGDDADQP